MRVVIRGQTRGRAHVHKAAAGRLPLLDVLGQRLVIGGATPGRLQAAQQIVQRR